MRDPRCTCKFNQFLIGNISCLQNCMYKIVCSMEHKSSYPKNSGKNGRVAQPFARFPPKVDTHQRPKPKLTDVGLTTKYKVS